MLLFTDGLIERRDESIVDVLAEFATTVAPVPAGQQAKVRSRFAASSARLGADCVCPLNQGNLAPVYARAGLQTFP